MAIPAFLSNIFNPAKKESYDDRLRNYQQYQQVDKNFRLGCANEPVQLKKTTIDAHSLKEFTNNEGISLSDFLSDKNLDKNTRNNYRTALSIPLQFADAAPEAQNLQSGLDDFKKHIDALNHHIKDKAPQGVNYASLSTLLREERQKIQSVMTTYQDKELQAFKSMLDTNKKDPEYRKAVAAFYRLDSDQNKSELDRAIDALQQVQTTEFSTRQKQSKEALDKKIADDQIQLHNRMELEYQRIAFFAMYAKGAGDEEAFKYTSLAEAQKHNVAQLTSSGKTSIQYDPEKQSIMVDLKSATSLLGKLDSDQAYREMDDVMQAARLADIKPVKITITGKKPEDVAELARRAYEAARKNGYAAKDIQLVIPKHSRPAVQQQDKDLKETDIEYIFNGAPGFKERIEQEAENMGQHRTETPENAAKMAKELAQLRAAIQEGRPPEDAPRIENNDGGGSPNISS